SLRSERHDDALAVGDRCRGRLARFRMALRPGNPFVGDALPENFSRSLVERDDLPGVLRHILRRLDVAVETRPDSGGGIAAHRGRDEETIAPDDWARHGDAR